MATLFDHLNDYFRGSIPDEFKNLEDLNKEYTELEWEEFQKNLLELPKKKFEFSPANILYFGLPG